MTNEEYKKYADRHAPRSQAGRNLLRAFLIGGLICCLGQFLLRLGASFGLDEESAAAAEAIALVFLGALLTGLGVYDRIAKRAGAGTLVPITGFANAVAACAVDAKSEGWILGVGAKMFTIAGPVIVYGTAAGVVCGLAEWLAGLLR